MSLGSIISSDRGERAELSIIKDLEKAMVRRPPDNRARGWHPSQLMEMCPRYEVLRQLVTKDGKKIEDVGIDIRTQMIFDVGTALHEWWQEKYFGPMGVLKGKWRCARCGFKTDGMETMPKYPHNCDVGPKIGGTPALIDHNPKDKIKVGHNRTWKFDEVRVESKKWGIVGHSDGIYILGMGSLCEEDVVLDIKTAGPTFWNGGGRPYPSNIFQINLYMWLLGLKKGILLYVDKGGVDKSLSAMCKEVVVPYNDSHRKDACMKIDAYRHAVAVKTLPPRMVTCELRPNSGKAKGCPLKSACLSDKTACAVEKEWGTVESL